MRRPSFGSTIAQRLQGQQQKKNKNKKQQEGGTHYQKEVLLISFDDKWIILHLLFECFVFIYCIQLSNNLV